MGGIGIVISVLGILVFILAEAWPLFRGSRGAMAATVRLPPLVVPSPAPPTPRTPAAAAAIPGAPVVEATPPPPVAVQALGTDEYQMYVYAVRGAPQVEFFRLPDA